uniref:Myozenin-2-like n=2 Tax=Denticeps clupeoides TaxID=299321 RepID=A0A8C4BPE1_9TELE
MIKAELHGNCYSAVHVAPPLSFGFSCSAQLQMFLPQQRPMATMVMHGMHDDLAKRRQQQALALSREARGEKLDLGRKVSTPKDLQMEELNLSSNRGSRMFQERQRRVERFTLESTAGPAAGIYEQQNLNPTQIVPELRVDKENLANIVPGKHCLVTTLKNMVAKKGSPNVLAPGYSGPLKEIPREKFNATVIPKSYCSPWQEALGDDVELLSPLNGQLPQAQQALQAANYRCFNRAATPFGGPMTSKRVVPVMAFESLDTQNLPSFTPDRMARRPNFNRAPRGWGTDYNPESTDL